ncbi:MAG: hypothetical protein ACHQZR_00455 [Candidatus Limnocylindrales bacterium]
MTPTPVAALPTPTPGPTSTPAPTLPPGTLVLDTVSQVRSLQLSPDGKLVAVLVWDTQSNGTVEVFTTAGTKVATYVGQGFGWLNAAVLAVFQPGADGVNGAVTLHLPTSTTSTLGVLVPAIPGTWAGVLGSGHGSLVLNSAIPQAEYGGDHFQVWTNGALGPLITTFGTPTAWSPDGTLLVLEHSRNTVLHATGIVLANTGYYEAELHVLRFPGGHALARFPSGLLVDSPAYFSRDGRYLAADEAQLDTHYQGPLIVNLTTGAVLHLGVFATVLGWTPDDRVVLLTTNERTLLWGPDGTLTVPPLPAGAVAYGPSMSDIAQANPSSDATPRLTLASSDGSVTVPMLVSGPPVSAVWTTDGQAVFVDTGSQDAQQVMDQLLRVPVP